MKKLSLFCATFFVALTLCFPITTYAGSGERGKDPYANCTEKDFKKKAKKYEDIAEDIKKKAKKLIKEAELALEKAEQDKDGNEIDFAQEAIILATNTVDKARDTENFIEAVQNAHLDDKAIALRLAKKAKDEAKDLYDETKKQLKIIDKIRKNRRELNANAEYHDQFSGLSRDELKKAAKKIKHVAEDLEKDIKKFKKAAKKIKTTDDEALDSVVNAYLDSLKDADKAAEKAYKKAKSALKANTSRERKTREAHALMKTAQTQRDEAKSKLDDLEDMIADEESESVVSNSDDDATESSEEEVVAPPAVEEESEGSDDDGRDADDEKSEEDIDAAAEAEAEATKAAEEAAAAKAKAEAEAAAEKARQEAEIAASLLEQNKEGLRGKLNELKTKVDEATTAATESDNADLITHAATIAEAHAGFITAVDDAKDQNTLNGIQGSLSSKVERELTEFNEALAALTPAEEKSETQDS